MKKKIPLDRIELYRANQAFKKEKKKVIDAIVKKEAPYKRKALKKAYASFFTLLESAPFIEKTPLAGFVLLLQFQMAMTQIMTIASQPRVKPKKQKGGIAINAFVKGGPHEK